ncbi:MAG: hypothetical protein IT381_06120 [Deltaproteobacteria bacterium]|nr:hypothetical protein [Deltaproteobacteria bacterium]
MTRTPVTKSGKTIAKTMVFDADAWVKFEERAKQFGISPSSFCRKVVNDYVDNRYVHLDTVKGGVLEALRARQEELHLTTLQPVIDMILADWMEQRKKKK